MYTPKFPSRDSVFYIGDRMVNVIPTEKRIRGYLDERKTVDSIRASFLRGNGMPISYCFPQEDVDFSLFHESGEFDNELGSGKKYSVPGRDGKNKDVLKYEKTRPLNGILDGMVVIGWNAIDRWEEEGETVRIHPRDPYTRIDVLKGDRKVEVWMKGVRVAESARPMMLFETGLPVRYYIPPDDVDLTLLSPSDQVTGCPYKGNASYWDLNLDGQTYRNMVWSYKEPLDEALRIKGHMCFYTERVDKFIIDGREL